MKKVLLAVAVLVTMGSTRAFAGHFTETLPPAAAYGCTPVSNGYDYQCSNDTLAPVIVSSSSFRLANMTLTQMNAKTPGFIGEMIFVSNALYSPTCVSSGTLPGAYEVVASSSYLIAGIAHCQ